MKKARIMLAAIATFSIAGGILASRARSQANLFFGKGSTIIGTRIYTTGCVISTTLNVCVNAGAVTTIPYSSTFNSTATTCIAHVIPCL